MKITVKESRGLLPPIEHTYEGITHNVNRDVDFVAIVSVEGETDIYGIANRRAIQVLVRYLRDSGEGGTIVGVYKKLHS